MSKRLAALVKRRWRHGQSQGVIRAGLILALLVAYALLLSGCGYPGQDPPCTGSRSGEPGCTNPAEGLEDSQPGGDWYVRWAFDIIRRFLSDVAINAVKGGVGIFWGLFANLGSTDFASCSGSGGGFTGSSPTCSAYEVFVLVRSIAFVLFPMLMAWKWAKSYFIGAFIETVYESALSFVPKLFLGGLALTFLDVIISGSFGLSNVLFETIIQGPQTLNELSTKIIGNSDTEGVASLSQIDSIGLLLFLLIICLAASIVFIFLGVIFFLRTIIVFILFAVSPLAVVAGLSEEFRSWFGRWLETVQAMLIAPIPVAICLALVNAFASDIPSAKTNPPEFMLSMIYVVSFLAIAAILMFRIAAQAGGVIFGAAAAGVGLLAGYGSGKAGAFLGRARSSAGAQAEAASSGGGATGREGGTALNNTTGGRAGSTSASGGTGSTGDTAFGGGGSNSAAAAAASLATTASPAVSAAQQQDQLVKVLRGLNESFSSLNLGRTVSASSSMTSSTTTGGGWSGGSPTAIRPAFNRGVASGVQSGLLWAGREAGVSAPYFPITGGGGSGYRSSFATDAPPPGVTATSSNSTYEENYGPGAQVYRRSEVEAVQPGGNGYRPLPGPGFVDPLPPAGPVPSRPLSDPPGLNGGGAGASLPQPAEPEPLLAPRQSQNYQPMLLPAAPATGLGTSVPRPALSQPLTAPAAPAPSRERITGAIPDPYGGRTPNLNDRNRNEDGR